jgi:hypothetical protein
MYQQSFVEIFMKHKTHTTKKTNNEDKKLKTIHNGVPYMLLNLKNRGFLIKDYKSGLYIHKWTYADDYNGALRLHTS